MDVATPQSAHTSPKQGPIALPDSNLFFEPEEVQEVATSDGPDAHDARMSSPPPRTNSTHPEPVGRSVSYPQSTEMKQVRPQPRPSVIARSDLPPLQEKKMHQTSTRIMRTNAEGRPFASDFHDLFSTLMVSLNLRIHKSRFRSYAFSFTTEEAVLNLANLKFAQSNRMPDPNDPSRVVTTTTTTTFSMAKDMAKALCQRFMDARFFESGTDRNLDTFKDKTIWCLTPKGICKLSRFCARNGIATENITKLLSSSLNTMSLITLERDSDTDDILQDRSIIEIIFRRFSGKTPNIKTNTAVADSDSISEYTTGSIGVKMAELRRFDDQSFRHSFTGRTAINWLMECTTVLDLDEAHELAQAFVSENLITYVGDSRGKSINDDYVFQSRKSSIYIITPKGRRLAGWEPTPAVERVSKSPPLPAVKSEPSAAEGTTPNVHAMSQSPEPSEGPSKMIDTSANAAAKEIKETNSDRLHLILADPGLRSQFREFLRANYCEENLSFYQDVIDFVRQINHVQALDGVSEGLAKAYSIYNAYLASGSPCELNLDHQLRLEMAAQMTRAVDGDETSMYIGLARVAELYDKAQKQVFRLMAGDSVPKFLKTPLYLELVEGKDSVME